ncbi:MAG: peptide deformylase, partial [Deltaproteobacteria bacterium]|nr:peptide deformylase [Deltaproteobacteria bacterium]
PPEEGCISIPGFRETITRNETVTVRALNEKGEQIEIKADGLLAICLQHEIDHLDGVLFVDHLSRLKREFFKRWLKKQAESE